MDGTTFRAPDSAENRDFGAQAYASGKVASCPQIRAVSVTSIPTHQVAGMAFGSSLFHLGQQLKEPNGICFAQSTVTNLTHRTSI